MEALSGEVIMAILGKIRNIIFIECKFTSTQTFTLVCFFLF